MYEVPCNAQVTDTVRICDDNFPDSLIASDSGTAYLWNTGDTTSWLVINDSGIYSITITIDTATTIVDSFIVFKWFPPIAHIAVDSQLTSNYKIYLLPSGEYMTPSDWFQWITPIAVWPPDQAQILSITDPCKSYCDDSPIGEKEVRLIASNQCGKDTTSYPIYCSDYCPPLFTYDFVNRDEIRIWPNPTSNLISIAANTPIFQILIFNSQGVLSKRHSGSKSLTADIQLDGLPIGLYFLRIKTEKETVTKRIIKTSN